MNSDDLVRLLFGFDETDFVVFSFPAHTKNWTIDTGTITASQPWLGTSKVKANKSFLKKNSTVFDAMFNETWDKRDIEMDDHVDFDQAQVFKLFLGTLYGVTKMDSLTIRRAINVHHYAHEYQIQPIMENLRHYLCDKIATGSYNVVDLIESIKMAELYSLSDYKSKLDQVDIDTNNHTMTEKLELFELCIEQNMFQLQETFLKSFQPFHAIELIEYLRVAKKYPRATFPNGSNHGHGYERPHTLMDKLQHVQLTAIPIAAVELYKICDEYTLAHLKEQVVKYLATKPLEESWPFKLINDVYEQNRADAMIRRERTSYSSSITDMDIGYWRARLRSNLQLHKCVTR